MISRIDIIGQNGNDGDHYEPDYKDEEGEDMEVAELISAIRGWADDRNLIEGSTSSAQFVKLMEEAGELAGNIAKGRDVSDDIGDMVVVLTILAAQNGLRIEDCIKTAWEDIKDRKGKMIDGFFRKEADLPVEQKDEVIGCNYFKKGNCYESVITKECKGFDKCEYYTPCKSVKKTLSYCKSWDAGYCLHSLVVTHVCNGFDKCKEYAPR